MKRAYIYARTSTERQQTIDRHSIESQSAQAKDFLKNYPEYDLQETIIDAASAFRGSHLDAGLGDFLKRAEKGEHEGDLLVVVYTDRLTRLPIDDAFALLKKLALYKVNLAITSLGIMIKHNEDLEFGLRMTLTALFHISHADSKLKSDRVRAAFVTRADKIRSGDGSVVKTSGLPAWISVVDGKYALDLEKVKVIEFIFEQKIKGEGAYRIAKMLIADGVPSFYKSWTRSNVAHILKTVAVYGAYQVQKTESVVNEEGRRTRIVKAFGEPIEGHFPAAITKETYEAAQYTKSITPKGRKTASNPFRGLMRCFHCGGRMSVTTTCKNVTYLRCNTRKDSFTKSCTAKSLKLGIIKERIRLAIKNITLPTMESSKPDSLALKGRIAELEKAIERNHKLMNFADDDSIVDKAMVNIKTFTTERKNLEKELYRVLSATPDFEKYDMESQPQEFNRAMLEVFDSIAVSGDVMEFHFRGNYNNQWEPALIDWKTVKGNHQAEIEESLQDYLEFHQMINNAPKGR